MEAMSERIEKIAKAVFHLSTPFCWYLMYLSATLTIHGFKAENQLPLMSGYRSQLGINPNRGRSLSRSRTQFRPRVVNITIIPIGGCSEHGVKARPELH